GDCRFEKELMAIFADTGTDSLMNSSPKRIFYDLVWRDVRRSLIHECIFRYRVREVITEYEWEWYRSRNGLREGKSFYRSPEHSYRSYSAINLKLPLPEQGGIPIDEDGVIVTRIFMDNLFLCPECCEFDCNENWEM